MSLPSSSSSSSAVWSQLQLSQITPSPPTLPHPQPASSSNLSYPDALHLCIDAHSLQAAHLSALSSADVTLKQLQAAQAHLHRLSARLETSVTAANGLLADLQTAHASAQATQASSQHLRAFLDQVVISPSLIRHVVDGHVAAADFPPCLAQLTKMCAVYEIDDIQSSALYAELSPVLRALVRTAVTKCVNFIHEKLALLKRPNTNVNIIKENALLPHRPLVLFVEHHAPRLFRNIRDVYVETMSRAYYYLFKKYANGLQALKQQIPSESADTLLGTLSDAPSSIFSRPSSVGGVGQFALADRLHVLTDVEAPAIVLATATDANHRFYYEQIHRSLGKMLSETCASEHVFCSDFFGESDGRMFNVFFTRIVGFLLDVVNAHTDPTRDTIGVLLALKVNDAQRSAMQMRRIRDLADYFIQVDIILKPKFKRLLDENVASMKDAAARVKTFPQLGLGDTAPHIVTRRFAEFSSSLLAIARFGTADDSILEGLRRLRAEYSGFLNAISTLFTRPKLRYVFLVNNIDHILSLFRRHSVTASEEYRSLAQLGEIHTAAYIEHEVADHFPDLVAFVRQYEQTTKAVASKRPLPTSDRVSAVLRQFKSNWRLGVQHMQDGVMREFPSFELGRELLQELFARLMAYHKRAEAAVMKDYDVLVIELVPANEIVDDLRSRTTDIS